jgi:ComF family protein
MSPLQSITKTWETLLDWIFPPKCGSCGRPGQWFCEVCRSQIAYVNGGQPGSGQPPQLPFRTSALAQLHSVAWFEGPVRAAIHNFKYRGQRALKVSLAGLLLESWTTLSLGSDLILAVPLHPKREKSRGYNQSLLLAQELGRVTGILAERDGLLRVRDTLPQVSLNMEERRKNVQGAFRGDSAKLRGRSILLIDDVCTTGATLDACARAALEAGALQVSALTVARPRAPWE